MSLEAHISQLRAELEKANNAHRLDRTEANLRRVNEAHDQAFEFHYRWAKYAAAKTYDQ